MTTSRKSGFTLVELLVVITIIGSMAALTAVMAPRIQKKSQQAKSVQNMRQIASLMTGYAAEHSNKLPPITLSADENADNGGESYWHILCQVELSRGEMQTYLRDKWWKENDSILINPSWPKKKLTARYTGYGMNNKIAENIAANAEQTIGAEEARVVSVSLASISDPGMTPGVMPSWNWYYACDKSEENDKRWKELSVENRLPVMFLDSHVEVMTTREYVERELYTMPRP